MQDLSDSGGMNEQPFVYFIILNWNQPELTIACLRSIVAQEYSRYKVLVVDNGSTDGSAKVIRLEFPNTVVIELDENIGYSPGNNVGIRYAVDCGADYVMLLNNDTLVDPGMLGSLVEVAESDQTIGILGPTMYFAEPSDTVWAARTRIQWLDGRAVREGMGDKAPRDSLAHARACETEHVDTCAALVRARVLADLHGMNPAYFINYDDFDLCWRAQKAGYRLVYVPHAFMWHRVSATMGMASPATTYYMTRNSLLFFSRNGRIASRLVAPLAILLRTFRAVIAWSFRKRYQDLIWRRRRDANLLAMRDFFANRFGKMSDDAHRACYG